MSSIDDLAIRAAASAFCQESPHNWSEMTADERLSWVGSNSKPEYEGMDQQELVAKIETDAESVLASMKDAMGMLSGGQGFKTDDSAELVDMAGLI